MTSNYQTRSGNTTLPDNTAEPHLMPQLIHSVVRLLVSAANQSGKIASAILLGTLLAACSTSGKAPQGLSIAAPASVPAIRPPAVGQQWVYQVRDGFSQAIVDEVTETVVSITPTIRIQRTSKKTGVLPDEIQSQWGMVTQDPHWEQPITFSKPIPAWPVSFDLKHEVSYPDQYQLLSQPDYSRYWNMIMTTRDWRSMTVPAGEFKTLYYTNLIQFQSNEPDFRISSERDDAVWFAPEVGRWVLRRSQGSYQVSGTGGDRLENFLQWELKSWK